MKYKDNVDILFQDNHILLCVKPAPMLTQKDTTKRISLEEILQQKLSQEQKKARVFLHPIHRLDYLVSGMVLFATSSKALARLQRMQKERSIQKIYYARVKGEISQDEGDLMHKLEKGSFKTHLSDHGKEARLRYKVITKDREYTLCEIELLTGRYHQIRAQFSIIGHPIVGDSKYGSKEKKERIDLHHGKISFTHPVTKEKMEFIDLSAPFLAPLR